MGLLLALRIALSLHEIRDPGIQYDEAGFVNAATLRVPGIFIAHSSFGIPTMIFAYTGALKSWLYEPVFAIFGTGPAAIRVPVVLLSSAGLILLFLAVRDLVNRPVALLAFVTLCFDNSVFWLTRDDVGPSAIEFFLKCAAVFCAARWARAPGVRWTGLLVVVLALGVSNKLNFIWTVDAAVAASAVVIVLYRRSLGRHVRDLAVWCAGLAAVYGAFLWYYLANRASINSGGVGPGAITHTWTQFQVGTRAILSGTWFYNYALGHLASRDLVAWVLLVLFATGAVRSVFGARANLPVALLALATILIAFQCLMTRQATAGWHFISIYPTVIVVAAYGTYVVAEGVLGSKARVAVALACVGAASLAYSGTLMAKYYRAISRDTSNPAWSPRIYQLSSYLQTQPGTVYAADWGISVSLFALHPARRYRDLEFELESSAPASLAAVAHEVAGTPGPKLVVAHGPSHLEFPTSLRDMQEAFRGHLRRIRTFTEGDGSVLYEVYRYESGTRVGRAPGRVHR